MRATLPESFDVDRLSTPIGTALLVLPAASVLMIVVNLAVRPMLKSRAKVAA